MEGDPQRRAVSLDHSPFQSTPSAWRETGTQTEKNRSEVFQSTPSAWRETKKGGTVIGWIDISIHSLRMEGDLPGHSLRLPYGISIHSLRMEGDPENPVV